LHNNSLVKLSVLTILGVKNMAEGVEHDYFEVFMKRSQISENSD